MPKNVCWLQTVSPKTTYFHKKETGLGTTHKYQPKNGGLETTNVDILGLYLFAFPSSSCPAKPGSTPLPFLRLTDRAPSFKFWNLRGQTVQTGGKQEKNGRGERNSWQLPAHCLTSCKMLGHPIPSAKNSCRCSHVWNRTSEGHRTDSVS